MEAKELMIGDWVIVNSKPTKVEEVDGGSINTTYSYGEIEGYIDEDEISPIPLTAEILEKNGFKKEPYFSTYDKDGVPFFVEIGKVELYTGGCWDSIIYACQYVHELQRALRCCGLTDLADNFQV